MADPERPQMII